MCSARSGFPFAYTWPPFLLRRVFFHPPYSHFSRPTYFFSLRVPLLFRANRVYACGKSAAPRRVCTCSVGCSSEPSDVTNGARPTKRLQCVMKEKTGSAHKANFVPASLFFFLLLKRAALHERCRSYAALQGRFSFWRKCVGLLFAFCAAFFCLCACSSVGTAVACFPACRARAWCRYTVEESDVLRRKRQMAH